MNPNIPNYIKDLFIEIAISRNSLYASCDKSNFKFKYRYGQKMLSIEFPNIISWKNPILSKIAESIRTSGYNCMCKFNVIYVYEVDDFELLYGALKLHVS